MKTLLPLLAFLSISVALPVRADIAADYAALTVGLIGVPGSGGTPGTVVMHGRTAFPVFTANTNGTAPVVAAGWWNDDTNSGRGLAYAHTGWASTSATNGLALSNAVRWAARGKANAVVGLGASMPAASWFTAQGYITKSLTTTMTATNNDFTGVDVALISMHSGYSSNALFKAMTFLTNGGGLLVFATPWALSSTAYADANKLLLNLGLAFSGDYNSGGPFAVPAADYPPHVSALNGLDLLLAQRAGTTNVAVSIQQAAADGIDGVLAVRPMFPPLTNGLAQLLATYGGYISINASRTLTKASVPIESLCERFQSGLFDITPAAQIPKHPDADDFPGAVSANAPVVNKTVIVKGDAPPDDPALINQGSHGTRQPVGLYARAGTVLRVTIPADKTGVGLRIQIGHHHDENFNLDSWHRHPKVARYEPLTNIVNEVASPFGGLVLVRVPPGAKLGDFPMTIEGAVEAPHFEQGADLPADWTRLKLLPGAQGYIRTTNFTAYVSRQALQGVTDAQSVAEFWGATLHTSDHYLGYLNRYREEAAKTDRDIVAGGGHAGYPVVMAYGRDNDELVNGVLGDGDWGFYHELGHTFQDDGHGWNGTSGGEVDVNLNPNLLMTLVHKRSLWDNNTHSTMDAANRAADRAAYFASTNVWSNISGGGTSAPYDFYFNLVESFGYDLWRRAFSRFYRWKTNAASEPSFAGLDNYNRWFVAMCEETGYDLTPYFDNYRWPVNATNKARFTALPAWSSNRPPTALNLSAPLMLSESAPVGTLVATFTTTDPDPGNLFIYSILSGNEDGAFTLDRWTGELRVASFDYERRSNYVLTVTVFDNALPRFFLTNTLSIAITNIAEPPQIVVPLLRTISGTAVGTVLGTIGAVPDTGRTISSFARVGGDTYFNVHPTSGVVTQATGMPPFNGAVFAITVRVTDSAGSWSEAQVPVVLNTALGLREQRWNGVVSSGLPTYDRVTNTWPSASIGDNYVRRLTAWLVPPRTGSYTFWVTGSDRATLFLGTNASPAGAVALCSGASTGVNSFDSDPGQRSAPVWLEAGQAYYFEVFQAEATGSDYAQAAWQGPGIAARELIPAGVLIPGSDMFFPSGGGTGPVTGVSLRIGQSDPGGMLTFASPLGVQVSADIAGDITAVTNVQFLVNGALSFSDDAPPFYNYWTTSMPGFHVLQAVARDQLGNIVTSPARVVQLVQSVTTNLLIASNAVWKYHNLNQDFGTAWRETNFNDGAWSSGPTRIGFGGDGEVTSIDIGPSGARYPCVYFRRPVVITNLSRHTGFTMSIARDDGAVAYVNGVEVFRTGMNAGTVSFTTPANNAADEQMFYATNLPPSVFREGTNTLTVEVHQVNATSGDLGFAMKLEGAFTTPAFSVAITDPAPGAMLVYPRPPTISLQPVSVQAVTPVGQITNLALRADGVVVSQTNATTATLRWPVPDGNPHVLDAVARNTLGQSVTSTPVAIFFRTNFPARPLTIFPSYEQTLAATGTVLLTATATDPDGSVADVEMILDGVSLGVLHSAPYVWLWEPTQGSHLVTARAHDNDGLLGFGNYVPFTVTAPPVTTNLTLVASNTIWKYNDEGVDLGNAWTNITYVDTTWSNGVARFGFGGDGELSMLRGQPRITYYFRKQIFVPAGFSGTNLAVKLSRDDGAVVYLNGREIVRDNMPAGVISYSTRPSASVSAPNEQAFYTFTTNAAALRAGTNVIAAEVHQIDGSSSDVGFDLELTAGGTLTAIDNPPPALNLEAISPSQIRFSFPEADGLAYAVEVSTDLITWLPVATNLVSGGAFQFTANTTNPPAQFFRVRRAP